MRVLNVVLALELRTKLADSHIPTNWVATVAEILWEGGGIPVDEFH
jgi:hypothetical protein